MEAQWGEEEKLLLIHDLGARGGWVVSVTPRPRFTPGERTPDTHWTGGWVGPRAGLNTEARGKINCLSRGSNLDRPVVQSVARHCTDWATPAPKLCYCLTRKTNIDSIGFVKWYFKTSPWNEILDTTFQIVIWGSHGDENTDYGLVGCDTV
jgi:hypothetical protein